MIKYVVVFTPHGTLSFVLEKDFDLAIAWGIPNVQSARAFDILDFNRLYVLTDQASVVYYGFPFESVTLKKPFNGSKSL